MLGHRYANQEREFFAFPTKSFGIDMTAYPVMSRINAALEQVEEFMAAHPSRQPDCPPELR